MPGGAPLRYVHPSASARPEAICASMQVVARSAGIAPGRVCAVSSVVAKELAMQTMETARVAGTHRPQVVGIQRRSPRPDTTEPWSNFDHHCVIDQVAVTERGGRVELFLHLFAHEGQGVGLE